MKTIFFAFIICFGSTVCHAQVLKDLGRQIKQDAKLSVRVKANEKMSAGLDSLMALPKKAKENKQNNKNSKPDQTTQGQVAQNGSINGNMKINEEKKAESEDMTVGEGFIKLSLSANEVFRGGTVIVSGSSIKYGNLKEVKMIVTGPTTAETETLTMYDNGSFAAGWEAEQAGEFTITVKSSDGKDQQSAKIKVYDIDVMDDLWVQDNIKLTHKTYDKLKQEAERVKVSIGQKDKQQLDEKLDDVKEKVDAVVMLFNSLNQAAKGLGEITKKGSALPPNLAGNLSQLNNQLTSQRNQMKQLSDAANHQPYDNTVCEYLVMLNEACAAFSTFTNIWTKSVVTVIKNVVMDKAVPKGVEVVNAKAGAIPPDYDVMAKQPAKLFSAALLDGQSLVGKLNAASFTGDIVQFASDFLMKKYCGIFKGDVKHTYKITYRNKYGTPWWSYSYETAAAVTFRYPKISSGKIIKMKGNIEGNATKFTFFQDVESMDDFRDAMKGRVKLTPIKLQEPLAVPFATSQKDELGFGALARGLVTPAYFNIRVDAEYDTDAETIKLFLNDPLIDFGLMVKYVYGYIGIAAGIPLVTRVEFPINKAKLTLNAVVYKNNELRVTKDAKNNLIVKGGGTREIGDSKSPIEHKINFNLSAKND